MCAEVVTMSNESSAHLFLFAQLLAPLMRQLRRFTLLVSPVGRHGPRAYHIQLRGDPLRYTIWLRPLAF